MVQLCGNSSPIYKLCKARKMTKNHYHRDDPAFVVTQIVFLVVTAFAYSVCFASSYSPVAFVRSWFVVLWWFFGVCYIGSGIVCVSLTYILATKLMTPKGHVYEVRRDVEILYAVDIHCNSFFSWFLWTQILQYFLLPFGLLGDGVSARLLSNLLYAAGATHYLHTTFKGYVELPFLSNQQILLYPLAVVYGLYLLSALIPINCTSVMLGLMLS